MALEYSAVGRVSWPLVATWALVACGSAAVPRSEDPVMAQDSIAITLTVGKRTYAADEPPQLALDVTNHGDATVTFQFSSGQRYELLILNQAGEVVWRWSADKAFVQMLGQEELGPGEALSFLETAPPLPPGGYIALGRLVATNRPLEARATFSVRSGG